MLTSRARIVLASASLMLVTLYAMPLWLITLEAPQYPEGIGLQIMLSTVKGQKPNDLDNINNLNHYIGMKRIVPDAIPELRIMPWAVGLLIVLGMAAALSGRAWMLYTWVGLFLVLAIGGLIDFWLWEYDYGHNLDLEHAIIKVPGMSYQPPLIGSKKLLNFTAHSWPGVGGWMAFVSLGTGLFLVFQRIRLGRAGAAVGLLLMLMVSGCSQGPDPILFGDDQDAFCRMTISDPAYATQVKSTKGKAYKFDSIECLLGFLGTGTVPPAEMRAAWVTASDTESLIPAESAWFVQSDVIRSPMGGGYVAFLSREAAEHHAGETSGVLIDWAGLAEGTTSAIVGHQHPE